jgi:hypothetical protein
MVPICSARCSISSTGTNPSPTYQYGDPTTGIWGNTFVGNTWTLPIDVNVTNYSALGVPAGVTPPWPSTIYAQQTTAAYTITWSDGTSYFTVQIPALATTSTTTTTTTSTTSTTCTSTGDWYEIAGGSPGYSAAVPAGTVYQVGSGPCITAATATNVDFSTGNLAVKYTFSPQVISVTNPASASTVTIPALIPISVTNLSFDFTDLSGHQMHCNYAPGAPTFACRNTTPPAATSPTPGGS